MNDLPAAESQSKRLDRPDAGRSFASASGVARAGGASPAHAKSGLPEIKIDKKPRPAAKGDGAATSEVFTLTLNGETIELLPAKTWCQLDHYKWTVRGKLPAEPAGLEIAADHVRMTGETVALNDPAACTKLERLFYNWLMFESENLELACRKAHPQARSVVTEEPEQPASPSAGTGFRVEIDKRGQVHVHCVHGRETLATIGLTVAGFTSLYQQGLIRRPHSINAGALHDWVELDGELYSFEKGRNDAARLEQALNQRFAPAGAPVVAMEVIISLNAASATGFDIQFPFMVAGVKEMQRHHLDEHSLELLQDPEHCGLLHHGILIKLMPPDLIFKQRTPDGGEQSLPWCPENTLTLTSEDGRQTTIRLNQPLNLFRLSAAELTAVFNHPSINRHSNADLWSRKPGILRPAPVVQGTPQSIPSTSSPLESEAEVVAVGSAQQGEPESKSGPTRAGSAPQTKHGHIGVELVMADQALPNLWLKEILAQPSLQHDWFACLVYTKMAEFFGNSSQGEFGPAACWSISLGETSEITDPSFKGIFLTEKGSLGFLVQEHMARFYNRLAFLGSQKAPLEGIEIDLIAVGLDTKKRVVFVVSDNYRGQFGVPENVLSTILHQLSEYGAVIMNAEEVLASREPLTTLWTVPAAQLNPSDPEAVVSIRAGFVSPKP